LKIALINRKYSPYGGVERYLAMVIRRLVERGHEVHIFAHEWDKGEAGSSGEVVHPVPILSGPSYVKVLSFAYRVRRLLVKEDFDIVHSFDRTISQDIYRAGGGCHKEYLYWKRKMAGPLMRALSPFGSLNPRHLVQLWIERRTLTETPITIVNAHHVKEQIVRHYGLPPERIRVIHNGVDLERFHPRNADLHRAKVRGDYGLGEDELMVLYVGSGFERKGLKPLIQALGLLAESEWKGHPFRLMVVGRGKAGPYEGIAEKCGAGPHVSFLGPLRDMPPLYGAADLFALPSSYEPFSNACMEALASGLPVVTTRTNGVSEVMAGRGAGGIAQDPLSPEDIASCLAPFGDATTRKKAGEEARKVAEEHPVDQKVEAILSLYDEYLASRSADG